MKPVNFNINHQVKVKLTNYGISVWAEHYNKYSTKPLTAESILKLKDKEDENGYTNFQMHDLMSVFGDKISMGGKLCFDTNIVLLPE